MNPESFADALVLYKGHLIATEPAKRAEEIFNQTQTALSRYTYTGMGYPFPQGRKPTQAETVAAHKFAQSVPLLKLKDALSIQAEVFKKLEAKPSQRYTYGSKLKNFVAWAKKEVWWVGSKQSAAKNYTPPIRHGYGNTGNKKTTSRIQLPDYGLKPSSVPEPLKAEVEQFYIFLTKNRYPGRTFDAFKPSTAKSYVVRLYLILGWFLQSKKLKIEDLSLNLLVPKPSFKSTNKKKAENEAEKIANYVDSWICDFLTFLETERKCSSTSLLFCLFGIHALIRFQYRNQSDAMTKNLPAIEMLRNHINSTQKKSKEEAPVVNEALKWLELPDVLAKIVTPLREECKFRHSSKNLRSDTAIARSFQLFIIWGCFTFRPPRRQQEFRNLKIGMSCPVKKPSDVAPNQVIHPLPSDRGEDKDHGYLFKDIDGFWYMDMTSESYKTGSIYKHQKLLIPNPVFSDGKCFYDYLQAFLYGYYRDSRGNWNTGLHSSETISTKGEWHCLRMAFSPEHNYVFVGPETGKNIDINSFGSLFKSSAHRLTGQLVTPHLLRDIFATWFLDQEYGEAQINSLAYAMGHSTAMLREMYDRRRPQQKTRPIEETMAGVVQKYIG